MRILCAQASNKLNKNYKLQKGSIGIHGAEVILAFVKNKDSDQPAHPRSLISAFVIRILERIITKLASCKNTIF